MKSFLLLFAVLSFSALSQASDVSASSTEIEKAIQQFPFVEALIEKSRSQITTENSCTHNWECWEGVEHCLDGECVPADSFNRCHTDIDCWPNECVDGVCED